MALLYHKGDKTVKPHSVYTFILFLGWFPKEISVCAHHHLVPLLPELLLSLLLIYAPFRREGRKLGSHTFHRKAERPINDPSERCGGVRAHPLLDTQEATPRGMF